MYRTVKSLNRIHKSHKKTKQLLLSLAEYVEIYVLFDRSERIPDLQSGERNWFQEQVQGKLSRAPVRQHFAATTSF